MVGNSLQISVRTADSTEESLAISIDGNPSGEATVKYRDATAMIKAAVDLDQAALGLTELGQFHNAFAEELLAYVLDRGAMAQESLGEVTYQVDGHSLALPLPSYAEAGLGHPNSW